ncbi:MAG: hypothetical protein EOP19_06795, partial [Hyphomicrobiales bacterium]
FWCALAFSLTSRAGQLAGDEAVATGEAQKSQILFAGLVTQMKAGNFEEAQFHALTSHYTTRLLDPFAEVAYARDVCEAAVPEAQALVEAAQPPSPPADAPAPAPAEPATPDAPAANAPAADAPGTEAPAAQ